MKKIIVFIFFSFLIALILLEPILRLTNQYNTKAENTLGHYQYFFQDFGDSWFHTHMADTTIVYQTSEFIYENTYNELGHREKSFTNFTKDSLHTKIVCLGDSYTEGDGAPYDSSWVRILEHKLNEDSLSFSFYNAGVNGSDVLFNHVMLQEKLLIAKPNFVIECINRSDILDVYNKGGKERFKEDGSLGFPNKKSWEICYKHSHLFRAMIGLFTTYNVNLINLKSFQKEEEKALSIIVDQILETHQLCADNNIEYILIIAPNVSTLKKDYISSFISLKDRLPNNVEFIDINDCMEQQFLVKELDNYSWKNNKHFNSKGYEIMANCISKNIKLK